MKSSDSSALPVAAAIICGLATLQGIRQPSDSLLAQHAWWLGSWLIAELGVPNSFQLGPAVAVSVVVGLFVYCLGHLLMWRLEIWSAGKSSDVSQQALRRRGRTSVEEDTKKLTHRHGR